MDTEAILLLRLFGYLLNAVLFVAVGVKYEHHRLALGGWIVWFSVLIMALLLLYRGQTARYAFLIDYVSMPLLYLNAVLAAVTFLRRNGHK